MEALCDRSILSDNKTALSEIAYYNFIQRQMDYSKDTKERPNIDDYKIAWKCFLHIIDILQPTDCIFVGVESVTLFEEIMDKYGVQYTGIDVLEKLNDAYPKHICCWRPSAACGSYGGNEGENSRKFRQ